MSFINFQFKIKAVYKLIIPEFRKEMATELADAAIEIDIFPWQFNFHKRVSFFLTSF